MTVNGLETLFGNIRYIYLNFGLEFLDRVRTETGPGHRTSLGRYVINISKYVSRDIDNVSLSTLPYVRQGYVGRYVGREEAPRGICSRACSNGASPPVSIPDTPRRHLA